MKRMVALWGFAIALASTPARADEIWVAATTQTDLGGLGIGSNAVWPVTPYGVARLAWGVPDDLQAFQSSKIVLIPHDPGGAATLNVFICAGRNAESVSGNCAGPIPHAFVGVANQLVEVDVTAAVAEKIGVPGSTYLSVLAYTSTTIVSDHVLGLRFAYRAASPTNAATLGANTFTGVQTAPAFVGDGSNLSSVNASQLNGLTSSAFAPVVHGHDVTQVSNAARLVGDNTWQGNQTIASGNISIENSTPTSGVILKNGEPFLHDAGFFNTFLGASAGNFAVTGVSNTAIGAEALLSVTSGGSNTANGAFALLWNSSGQENTASGSGAMVNNTTGSFNTALGTGALSGNRTGDGNTAIGDIALQHTTGSDNVALGRDAGLFSDTGSNNIYLGARVHGTPGEENTIRLGRPGIQNTTVVAGIRGTAVAGPEMVVVDADGRLGSAPVGTGGAPGPNTIGSTELIDNSVAPADVAFNYAGSASKGGAASNADRLDGLDSSAFAPAAHTHHVSQVTNAARLADGNAFTGPQTIAAGNLDLGPATPTTGMLLKGGVIFMHNFGTGNTFLGENAGNTSMTGGSNTGAGRSTLLANTEGSGNAAFGNLALVRNTSGFDNTGMGAGALFRNTEGRNNTAVGWFALDSNVSGDNNVAIGIGAGGSLTTGSNNIYLGNVRGDTNESNSMYLGAVGFQTKTVIAGVRGTSVVGPEMVVVDADGRLGSAPVGTGGTPGPNTIGTTEVIDNSLTPADVAFNYAGSVSKGGAASNSELFDGLDSTAFAPATHGHDVSQVTNAARLSGGNAFLSTQTINEGNLNLNQTTQTTGTITKNGQRFLHNFGVENTFLGVNAGTFAALAASERNTGIGIGTLSMLYDGQENTAIGAFALRNAVTASSNVAVGVRALVDGNGHFNTAVGYEALRAPLGGNNTALGKSAMYNTQNGNFNTATGAEALWANVSGESNTANGSLALERNTSGSRNTAVGELTLFNSVDGDSNVAIGSRAGQKLIDGSFNIYIGAETTEDVGAVTESNTIHLGAQGLHERAFIGGVRGVTANDAVPVLIGPDGQLGTIQSSRRFKEDIHNMGDASSRLFKLHPVTFRYTQAASNGSKPIQFGLIAEEVAEVFPELAARSADGQIETVHYEKLSVLLLNELQKQQTVLDEQQRRIESLERRLNELLAR